MYCSLMRLVQIFGAGNPVIHTVLDYYGDAESACAAIDGGECDFLDEKQHGNAKYVTAEKMNKIADFCERREIKLLSIYDRDYPEYLKEIYNPPVLLFYKGSLECLDALCITAVGSRDITPYINKLASRICTDLSKNGVTLISGMAHGVDSVAHNACVNLGNPTIGVLACGLNYDYPHGSSILRNKIVSCGGLYLSELMPNASPTPEYFRARNRILAGLSSGTAVFQAGDKSGALITAQHAVENNRDVFCVPPPDIFDVRYSGVVSFLRDGAVPLFNHDDILNFYRINY